MVKSGLDFFYFEIHQAPSEMPANLPGQFSLSVQIGLQGLVQFQNKKNLDHFSPSFLTQKCWFKTLYFSSLILRVLGGVNTFHERPWA